mgnify:CR=1 FL=1|tara:strand:- start:17358 stop:18287 length:930 start_codon:yes stop_codon:yes gene_type:complete
MRILIELPTWLGDAVMATPAIENLINHYDKSEIILIGSSLSIEIYKNHPRIYNTYLIKKKYISLLKISKKIGSFDIYFSFRSSFRAKFLKLFITSKRKFQFNGKEYRNRHQVEKYNDFVNDSLEKNFYPDKLIIYPSLKHKSKKTKPLIGISPGASYGNSKRWSPKEYAIAAAELSNKFDILIFGDIRDIGIAKDIENFFNKMNVKNYQNLVGRTSIEELIFHISTLDFFITGDSGSMHIAAAHQVPTVAIFGPTNNKETSQWMNKKSTIVKKNLECQPCMKRNCPLKHNNCMKLIKAQDVLDALRHID